MNFRVSISRICFFALLLFGCDWCYAQTSDMEIAKQLMKQAGDAYESGDNVVARKLYQMACDTLDYETGKAITTGSIERAKPKLKIERACLYMLAMIDSDEGEYINALMKISKGYRRVNEDGGFEKNNERIAMYYASCVYDDAGDYEKAIALKSKVAQMQHVRVDKGKLSDKYKEDLLDLAKCMIFSSKKEEGTLLYKVLNFEANDAMIKRLLELIKRADFVDAMHYANALCFNYRNKGKTLKDEDYRTAYILAMQSFECANEGKIPYRPHVRALRDSMPKVELAKLLVPIFERNGKFGDHDCELMWAWSKIIIDHYGDKSKEAADVYHRIANMYVNIALYYLTDVAVGDALLGSTKMSRGYGKSGRIKQCEEYALKCYEDAITIFERIYGKQSLKYAMALFRLSQIYYLLGENKKAIDKTIEAYEISTKIVINPKDELYEVYKDFLVTWIPGLAVKTGTRQLLSEVYNSMLLRKYIINRNSAQEMYKWQDVRSHLGAKDVAIEFFKSDDGIYYALILRHKGTPQLVQLCNESEIQKYLSKAYNSTYLYEYIWKPIEASLNKEENVYFTPDGLLYEIAIEAVPITSGLYFNEKYKVCRLSSTAELAKENKRVPIGRVALFGGLKYGRQMATKIGLRSQSAGYLKWTLTEVENISEILKKSCPNQVIYTDSVGTEERFKQLSGQKFDIIHLATHGFYLSSTDVMLSKNMDFLKTDDFESMESQRMGCSGLLFAGNTQRKQLLRYDDGVLTAEELSKLSLENVDLVTLSACQTAKGDVTSNGLYGLQLCLKTAGVRSMLLALWKVDDEATCLFMTKFYESFVFSGDKRVAYAQAQQAVRDKYKDPYYWAAFVLVDGI